MTSIPVRRALLSVSDKTGLEPFATALHLAGVELVASGGTAAALTGAGLPVIPVAEVTGAGEMLGGRVKTLHPAIHAGILADLGDPAHRADLDGHGLTPIQLVVVNLYPFEAASEGNDPAEAIEAIDIGGPALVRAAAKNHAWVGVVTDPGQYDEVAEAIAGGGLGAELRKRLAAEAFFATAAHDASIVEWLERGSELPRRIVLPLQRHIGLRYGENPHQRAALYTDPRRSGWWDSHVQRAGRSLSYLNVFDADAARVAAHDLASLTGRPSCVVVKHGDPCGAASQETLAAAYEGALAGDPQAAFGGVVAFDRVVDEAAAVALEEGPPADLVVAPGFDAGVVDRIHRSRATTAVVEGVARPAGDGHLRQVDGAWLLQDPCLPGADPAEWDVVTDRRPTRAELADAAFAFRVCARVSSNAVVMARDGVAWGIGGGQPSRADAAAIAAAKAGGQAAGGACASDGFFPFPDGVEAAAEAGVAVVVQPGGSIRDDEVIARADELGLAMVLTGERAFRH